MAKITIKIDMGNAAFEDDGAAEVARILETYARDLRDTGAVLCAGDTAKLFDVNGNSVGTVKVTR